MSTLAATLPPEEIMRRVNERYCPAIVFGLRFLGPDNSDRARPWFTLKPSPIHDILARDITQSGKNVLGIGPREFAKSRIGLTCDLHDGVTLVRDSFLVVGNSSTLAEYQNSHIIDQCENNRLLQDQFKIRPGRIQRADHYEIKVDGEKVTFFARGFDGTVRGFHVSRLRFDDIETTKDSAYTMAQNYEEIHGTFMGALSHVGDGAPAQLVYQCNWVGEWCTGKKLWDVDTVQHPEFWVRRMFCALSNGPTGETDDIESGESVWPEFRNREELLKIRNMMNAGEAFAFEREYQNRIVSMAHMIWSRDMFTGTYTDLPERRNSVYRVYIDSAQSIAETGDETAITTWGKATDGTRKGEYPFVDARVAHLPPDDIAREVLRQYIGNGTPEHPQCDAVKLESKTSRGEDPLAALIRRYGRENNVNVNISQLVPVQHGDKRTRSVKASQVGRSGAITLPVHPSADMNKCVNQMVMFNGKTERNMHAVDDGHDSCVWGLIDLMPVRAHDAIEHERREHQRDHALRRLPAMTTRAA
jgi:hypothetical protein